jgi:O-antigen/teichoic acid export membrane protein
MTVAVPPASRHPETPLGATPTEEGGAVRRGALLFFSAGLISQASALLRYVVVARLLGPEQLGLAAALTVTAGFFDMISDTGSDRFLIQDRYGGTMEVQKLVQLVFVCRGILVAASLAIFAIPIAGFYNSPRLAEGLAVVAIVPLIMGFLHLDTRRVQRSHDFRSEAICVFTSESIGLVCAVIAAWLLRDFKAVAYGLIARAIARVVCSHILAWRPYRLGWDRAHAPRLARFATPLMLNGLMLFILSQGDRVIVGRHLGITELGYYSTIMLLIVYPSNAVAMYMHAIFVPMIAARRDSRSEQDRSGDRLGGQTLMLALAMAVGFAIVAPPMVPILFGSRFAQPALLIGLIGILQAARFLLSWPTTAALAMGRSTTVLISNIAHLLIFPGAFIGMRLIGGLSGVVVGFIGAELFAIAVALVLLNRNVNRRPWCGFERIVALILTCGAIVGWNLAIQAGLWSAGACMLVASIVLIVSLYRRENATFQEVFSLARHTVLVRFFGTRHC